MVSSIASLLLPLFVASTESGSAASSGGYQQYYQQYMEGGSPSTSGDKSSSGGYEQYYQQYMGGSSPVASRDKSGKTSQPSGGYQEYYQQYVSGSAQGESKGSNGGYEKFYQQYVGGGAQDASSSKSKSIKSGADQKQIEAVELSSVASSSEKPTDKNDNSGQSNGGYQQYYQQYMGGAAKSGSKGSSGGYEQYYQQYMGGGSSGSSSNKAQSGSKGSNSGYEQYYQQYLGGASSDKSGAGSSKSDQASGYQQYYQQYMGGGAQSGSKSSSGGYDQYYQKYMKDYAGGSSDTKASKTKQVQSGTKATASTMSKGKSVAASAESVNFLVSPSVMLAGVAACSTKSCVEDWRKKSEADVKKHVPKDYQHFPLASVEKEYKSNLARIAAASNATIASAANAVPAEALAFTVLPPMMLAEVFACSTKECVEDWRKRNEAEIKKYVPKDYQHFTLASVEKEYKAKLARIAAAKNGTSASVAHAAPADGSAFVVLPPTMLEEVASCMTKNCIEDWRKKNEALVKKYVPKDYQDFSIASVEKEYKKSLARIEVASATNSSKPLEKASKSVGTFLAASRSEPRSSRGPTFVLVALLSLVVGLFAVRLRSRQRTDVLEEDLLRHEAMLAA